MSEIKQHLTLMAEAAFEKAAANVVRLARQTGTPILVWENGRVREIAADHFDQGQNRENPTRPQTAHHHSEAER
jgi:hypothetical protein